MAKTNHLKTVVFTQDYANRKKGSEWQCDGMIASDLVRIHKVAVFKSETIKNEKEKK